MNDRPQRIAFLGLGRMGSRMAANLASAGFELVVYNRTIGRAESFVAEAGGRVAASGAEAAAEADTVVTMLADGDALIEVLSGQEGVLKSLRAGAIVIDMGTSGPSAVAAMRQEVLAAGGDMVDAPVSGSTPAAEAGTLQIMAGGSIAAFERARPVLDAMGEPIHVGPAGAGATLKLATNSILMGLNQALAEGVVLAESAGVSPATALDVIAAGAAGAPLISYRRPQYLDPEGTPVTFTMELAQKDLRLALEQASAAGVDMSQATRTMEIIADMVEHGDGDRDLGYVIESLRRRSPSGS